MKTRQYSLGNLGDSPLQIGKRGENRALAILIDVTDWLSVWPGGKIYGYIRAPSGHVQSTGVTVQGGVAQWIITRAETAEAGIGKLELSLENQGTVVKSTTATYYVAGALPIACPEDPGSGDYQTVKSALRLETPREIALTGDVSGAAMFDGTTDIQIETEIATLTYKELEEMLK